MGNIKKLFDWCVDNEGDLDSMHIIRMDEGDTEIFRLYHKNGHCVIVTSETLDLSEDESCENIDGVWYGYDDELFDGFIPIDIKDLIKLLGI